MSMKVPRGLCHTCLKPVEGRVKYHDGCRPPSKYRSRKTVGQDGITFDSEKEAERYANLFLMERAGLISDLRRQVWFNLEVSGILVARYRADAVYTENGAIVVEDTKSEITRRLDSFRVRKKLMLAVHGITILET